MAQVKGNSAAVDAAGPDTANTDTADASEDNRAASVDAIEIDHIDDLFKDLKTLLNTVEKLQKARQEVGDIKPLILRLLDGELLSGSDLDDLRSGISGLSKLLKLYGDYQGALQQAQPARTILDQILQP